MKQILLCTHGNFAIGCKHSLEMIAGELANVHVVSVQMEDHVDDVSMKIEGFINGFPNDAKIIVTDIPGGSPTQAAFKYIASEKQVFVLTGLNLGLLLELVLSSDEDVEQLIRTSIERGKDTMQFLNDAFVF